MALSFSFKKGHSQSAFFALYHRIDVPPDGSCLFWAVTWAYLAHISNITYVASNPLRGRIAFAQACQRLFGEIGSAEIERISVLLNRFCSTLDSTFISFDSQLRRLIPIVFREQIVEIMRQHESEFKGFISVNFSEYLKSMSSPMRFGGEPEIRAMVKLLDYPIQVVNIQQRYSVLYEPSPLVNSSASTFNREGCRVDHPLQTPLCLFYQADKRHYFFGLDKKFFPFSRESHLLEFQAIADHWESLFSLKNKVEPIPPLIPIARKRRIGFIPRVDKTIKNEPEDLAQRSHRYSIDLRECFKKAVLGFLLEWSLHIHCSPSTLTYFLFRRQIDYPLSLANYPMVLSDLESNLVWEREFQKEIDFYLSLMKTGYIGVSGALMGFAWGLYQSIRLEEGIHLRPRSSVTQASFFSRLLPQQEREEISPILPRFDRVAYP